MPYRINRQEFESVSALAPANRFEHFVKRAADWEEVWSLKNGNGWVLLTTSAGKEVAPFWPHPDYAQACAVDEWADCAPALIELAAFLERWVPGLTRDGRSVSVFATPGSPGAVMAADALKAALQVEIETHYGGSDDGDCGGTTSSHGQRER